MTIVPLHGMADAELHVAEGAYAELRIKGERVRVLTPFEEEFVRSCLAFAGCARVERSPSLRDALVRAESWIITAAHGDNCHLHDDGGEFDACFCGKDIVQCFIEEALANPGEQEACSYCGEFYPKPVSLHHTTEECHANEARNASPSNVGEPSLDVILATVAGVPCRFCLGPGSSNGSCPQCGKPASVPVVLQQDDERPYRVEQEAAGCEHCGIGRTFVIVFGPDGVALGETWPADESDPAEPHQDACDLAEDLNHAYQRGAAAYAPKMGNPDTARLDYLERKAWEPHGASIALAIFPFTREGASDPGRYVSLAHVDEGADDRLDEFAEGTTLREAIDAAMAQNAEPKE